MRRITLLRHAKSDWSAPPKNDFDRPLNQRGESNGKLIGTRLKNNGVRPSLIISSDAVRAMATARLIARNIGYPIEFIQPDHNLYLASPVSIIDVLECEGENYNDVMVVGHNPGLTELANRLCNSQIDNIPTCGIFAVDMEIDSWADLANTQGTLNYFDYPKNKR
jgi:phosphohistidine phosphatase